MAPMTPQERYRRSLDKLSFALRAMLDALQRDAWADVEGWRVTAYRHVRAAAALDDGSVLVGDLDDLRLVDELPDRVEVSLHTLEGYIRTHSDANVRSIINGALLTVAQANAAILRVEMHPLPAEQGR